MRQKRIVEAGRAAGNGLKFRGLISYVESANFCLVALGITDVDGGVDVPENFLRPFAPNPRPCLRFNSFVIEDTYA